MLNIFHFYLIRPFCIFLGLILSAKISPHFVNNINRLIWKFSLINMFIGQSNCGLNNLMGVTDVVMFFKFWLESFNDFHCIFNRRLDDINFLKTARQCLILFKELSVLIISCASHTSDKSAG